VTGLAGGRLANVRPGRAGVIGRAFWITDSAWSSITVEGAQVPPGALQAKLPLMLPPNSEVQAASWVAARPITQRCSQPGRQTA
jgi:hypothetical protein